MSGENIVPLPRQQVALSCPAFELMYGGEKGGGKPLDCTVPVPTPTGWTTQGELKAGDRVIGADGRPALVLGTTGPMYGRPCWRLHFSDKTSIVCDDDHPWETLSSGRRRVRTTGQIAASLGTARAPNHSIDQMRPMVLAPTGRPGSARDIGLSLGDSSRNDGKTIPRKYMRSSAEERLALLRGFMDARGTVGKNGSCHFSLVNGRLFHDVVELVRSLGIIIRTSIRTWGGTCDCDEYRASFSTSTRVFTLPHKARRQNRRPGIRARRRFIVKAERVPSVPVCCIKTDRPDGLYVAGEQWIVTHNTFYLLVCWGPLLNKAHERKLETGREQRHVRIPIFRKNLGDLKDIVIKSHEVFPLIDPTAHYASNEKIWRFWSGATVEFHHLDGPEDHVGWNGQAIMGLGVDQAEDIEEHVYAFLLAQVRTADPHYRDLMISRLTANPGGKFADWIKRRFVDPYPKGNRIIEIPIENRDGTKVIITRAFIPASLRDNPHLSADGRYEATIRASGLPEHLIRAYLDGDWDAVKGAFFASLIRPDRLLRSSFPISGAFDLRYGLDWGSTNPAAVVWGAKDADDRLWIIDELVEPGITGRAFGEKMYQKYRRTEKLWSRERVWSPSDAYGLIDSQAMGKYGAEGATPADGIRSWGFRLFPANKDRYAGIEQLCQRMLIRADGMPGMVIFGDRCPQLAAALSAIPVNPKDQQDYDPDSKYAHVVDALRFYCMDNPVADIVAEDPKLKEERIWQDYVDKARARQHPQDGEYSYAGYE